MMIIFFLIDLHNDPLVLRNVTNPTPITFDSHMVWWKRTKDDPTQLRLVFTIDDVRVGLTKFYNIDRTNMNCSLGADIVREYRGLGHANTMWSLMLDKCFNEMCLHRVALTTAEYNEIGIRVYKKLGFIEEGRLTQSLFRDGCYHDQITMYLLREAWSGR